MVFYRELTKIKNDESGASLLEFAASAMLLLTVMLGFMEYSRAIYTDHFVSYAATEAARYASLRGSTYTASLRVCGNFFLCGDECEYNYLCAEDGTGRSRRVVSDGHHHLVGQDSGWRSLQGGYRYKLAGVRRPGEGKLQLCLCVAIYFEDQPGFVQYRSLRNIAVNTSGHK